MIKNTIFFIMRNKYLFYNNIELIPKEEFLCKKRVSLMGYSLYVPTHSARYPPTPPCIHPPLCAPASLLTTSFRIFQKKRGGGVLSNLSDRSIEQQDRGNANFFHLPIHLKHFPWKESNNVTTADRRHCDDCSSALKTGHYAKTKTYSHSA